MKKPYLLFIAATASIILCSSCQNTDTTSTGDKKDSLQIKESLTSPVLSAAQSLKTIQAEDGFSVQLVAAEPLVTAPVAFAFDDKNRLWVAEMISYMPDTLGNGEDVQNGNIVILSDTNGDGKMDNRTVFLDSLLLPRAFTFYKNGILVATTPNLWFYEIENDKPVKKTLVDGNYTIGGNVEHEPNGLLRGLDNWIYNAKFDKRYRKKGNKWLTEKTHFRGQWGIAQDDNGRLFYNNNTTNLLGDYFSAGLGADNPAQKMTAGYNEKIVEDNRVYPAAPTPGVNRGYMEGILDDSLRLVNFTAACSPYIYRGHLFGNNYKGNAFVAEPAGNLIKRNIIHVNGFKVTGTQAYQNKEFIASTDERFRPVFLNEGPDGALYIADMYRGIIQHRVYLTDYLKSEIKSRQLAQPLNCGRIYKVVPTGKKATLVQFSHSADTLVQLLQHPSGWVRDKAQQLIIDLQLKEAAPALKQLLQNGQQPLTTIHAMWTLEGLDALIVNDVLPLTESTNWNIKSGALTALGAIANKGNQQQIANALQNQLTQNDTLTTTYVALLASKIKPYNKQAASNLVFAAAKQFPQNVYVADAVISNLKDEEKAFYKKITAVHTDSTWPLIKDLKKVISDKESAGKENKDLAKKYPNGAKIFNSVCQSCHGTDGNGIRLLAPPLNKSEWVTGSKNRLISIVLYGLSGPIQVNDKMYKAPEISGEMPGIGANKAFSDEDIAQLLNYIRNSWSNKAGDIHKTDVQLIRNKFKNRQQAFTADELKQLP